MGIAATVEKRFDDAISDLTKCLDRDLTKKARVTALSYRAFAYDGLNFPDKAVADQKASLELVPTNDVESFLMLAYYQRKASQFTDALATVLLAEGMDSGTGTDGPGMAVRYHRARIHYEMGRYADVIDGLTKAIPKQPTYEFTFYYRGLSHQALGHADLAKADFLKVAELAPQTGFTAEIVAKLKEYGIAAKLKQQVPLSKTSN